MPKHYRVRNWKEYNTALVNRGSITFWVSEDSLGSWYQQTKAAGKGRPNKYSDIAVETMLVLRQVYRLGLRQCQGFVKSLFEQMGILLDVPHYSRLSIRAKGITLPALPRLSQAIHMVIDSSGLKVFGEGEWKVRQHGYDKRRTWRKLHIGIDESSRLIVSEMLTDNGCGDDKQLPVLLSEYGGKIKQVSADGAYDSHACFDEIASYDAIATIPTQPNPKHKPKLLSELKRVRDKVAWAIQTKGREVWKRESGYHRRSLSENGFYRYKQVFGDKLRARCFENQAVEALLSCHLLNKMTLAGMPQYEAC